MQGKLDDCEGNDWAPLQLWLGSYEGFYKFVLIHNSYMVQLHDRVPMFVLLGSNACKIWVLCSSCGSPFWTFRKYMNQNVWTCLKECRYANEVFVVYVDNLHNWNQI